LQLKINYSIIADKLTAMRDIKKLIQPITVVGIGASAGGLEPLQLIISHFPTSLPSTAIIIAQHLSPDYKSMLVELLARKTTIPVKHIEDGGLIEGNTIYIAPPNADISISNNKFRLLKPIDGGAHPSVDILFTSIADNFLNRSCGIVLSGTGKDGMKGIIAIKKAGGIAVVQDPSTAKYDGMPKAAIGTGVIDHIITPEKIGTQFVEVLSHTTTEDFELDQSSENANDTFVQIFDLLERRIGIDFSNYKISTLSRRLQKRITEKKFDTEQEYLEYIRHNPEELEKLFEALLIGVTSFFRDPITFQEIEIILGKIILNKKSGEPFRMWIPGCATGEEAYTYALLIHQILKRHKKHLHVQLFATDIDIKALHKARVGIYPTPSLATVPKKLLTEFFTKINGNSYELHKDIRKMVLFSRHDVTSNPPFLRLDAISCRNLLIYFNNELQKRVFPLFYYALNPNGYLILGKSENIGQFDNLFAVINNGLKIFQRKPLDGKIVKFPHFRPSKAKKIMQLNDSYPREDLTVSEMVKETLYNNFDHPYVVINENMDIVEVHGDISYFLKFKEGTATLNFMKLVIPQLQIESRAIISKAITTTKQTTGSIRKITVDDQASYIQLVVKPLLYTKTNNPLFIVIFEKIHLDEKFFNITADTALEKDSSHLIELEQELDATKEHMNSLIEELESSNEELQALNEEMQASNEELQASNEELETSNEELQATNEELENAYSELREANTQILQQKQEIEFAAQNLDTLLNNTLVGFILIDKDYRVLACNNTAFEMYQTLFNTKIREGISFIKVLPDTIFPTFHANFRNALDGNQVVTEETIKSKNGKTLYLDFNYTPVITQKKEKEARMVAVSFVDITKRKQAELSLKKAVEQIAKEKQFMETLSESLPNMVWTTDDKGIYLYCNQHFLLYTGTTLEEINSLTWKPFIHPSDWKRTASLWKKSLKSGERLVIEHRIKRHDNEYRWHLTLATAIKSPDDASQFWVGTSTDIHEQKMLDERKNEFISIASHELKTPVTSLKGYAQVLNVLLSRNDTTKFATTVQKMNTQLNRLTDLINDLLDVSRIESGKLQFTKRTFAFDEFMDGVIDEMQLISHKHTILKHGKINKDITTDKDRLEQVMINLISNAIKYSPNADKVFVKAKMNHKEVIVSVQDFGIGIPKEKQDKVFARFFRVNGKNTETYPGMGLGLYISSEIIKRLGGRIWFESKEGTGSTFYFTVPLTHQVD
jgi:two-component system, chemotaxis family, CheB/CheR fusion protein